MNSSFLNGLRPELSAAVKQSCIGWNEARVEIIRKHAVHAEEQHKEKQKKKKEKADKELHKAMYEAVQMSAGQPRGRGTNNRGQGRGRGERQRTWNVENWSGYLFPLWRERTLEEWMP